MKHPTKHRLRQKQYFSIMVLYCIIYLAMFFFDSVVLKIHAQLARFWSQPHAQTSYQKIIILQMWKLHPRAT